MQIWKIGWITHPCSKPFLSICGSFCMDRNVQYTSGPTSFFYLFRYTYIAILVTVCQSVFFDGNSSDFILPVYSTPTPPHPLLGTVHPTPLPKHVRPHPIPSAYSQSHPPTPVTRLACVHLWILDSNPMPPRPTHSALQYQPMAHNSSVLRPILFLANPNAQSFISTPSKHVIPVKLMSPILLPPPPSPQPRKLSTIRQSRTRSILPISPASPTLPPHVDLQSQ